MRTFTYLATALLVISCTKKVPVTNVERMIAEQKKSVDTKDTTPAPEVKKEVAPPRLLRVDEDTVKVQDEEVGVVNGTETTPSTVIDATAPALIAKDSALFQIKAAPIIDPPVVEIKASPVADVKVASAAEGKAASAVDTNGTQTVEVRSADPLAMPMPMLEVTDKSKPIDPLVLFIPAAPQSEFQIIASGGDNGLENLCLAQSGTDVGKFVPADSPYCWRTPEASPFTEVDSNANVTVTLDSQDGLASLEDHPVLVVQVKPPEVEAAPDLQDQSTASAPQSVAQTAQSGPDTKPIPVVVPENTMEEVTVVESLPLVITQFVDKTVDAALASPNVSPDDAENLVQFKNRGKKAGARYEEKVRKYREITQERNRLRQERKLNREKTAKVKNAQQRICRRKNQDKCSDQTGIIQELAEKENKKTAEIAELKVQLEQTKSEVLEEIREIHTNQAELKAIVKKNK